MASIKHGVKYMTKSVKPLFCNQINTVKLTSCGFSTSNRRDENKSYKLLVVGGGCGGLATGSMFSRKLGKGQVAILEPREVSVTLYNDMHSAVCISIYCIWGLD